MDHHDETDKTAEALERAAAEYGKHSGPQSSTSERAAFGRDLRTSALRFARAYYAEARELGLIPEYERTSAVSARCPGSEHRNHIRDTCNGSCCTACGGPIDDNSECRCDSPINARNAAVRK